VDGVLRRLIEQNETEVKVTMAKLESLTRTGAKLRAAWGSLGVVEGGRMRYGSVCSGIEAASVAWRPLGWEAAFYAEIEPFPCRVLQHHYPNTPNLGDLTRFHEWPDATLDVLVSGTPCQSFSFAGLRAGLADPRGNLALVYLGLVDRYRPRWVVWENVPGVLSSSGGRDFGAFLGGLGELGYGWAYRVLDAQYFGVAQRRRRVFVVGYLGDWRRAAAVLIEPESLRGDSAPRREKGERITNSLTERADRGGTNSEGQRLIAPTLPARQSGGGGLGTDFDCDGGVIHSLRAEGFDASEDGTGRGTPIVPMAVDTYNLLIGDVMQTLQKGGGSDQIGAVLGSTVSNGDTHSGYRDERGLAPAPVGVRRLTPRECERLQGFPDDYTLIPGAKDGPRYKALGNSMCMNVMRWIGERIALVESLQRSRTEQPGRQANG
jgi:DNA (cytosine-5)-methyltransferase 1